MSLTLSNTHSALLLESNVRTYCREFPAVFTTAQESTIVDDSGQRYLDFFSGAGALNYGHNNRRMKRALLDYIEQDGISHSLDFATEAKERFLERLRSVILEPRGMDYRVQFTGPTGADAVEAALKLARKVTGRLTVAHFVNSYHGMTLGALAVTSNESKRSAASVPLQYAMSLPFDGDLGAGADSLAEFEFLLRNESSGREIPAAVIVETVQAEGGVRVASDSWLRRLAYLAKRYEFLLIVDDIQVGCGRTGSFFSFESAGLMPDLICLSKSIGGYGLPMSIVLIKPELDIWNAGEHTGTFRGNNLAFVTAAEALGYWETPAFSQEIHAKAQLLRTLCEEISAATDSRIEWRGRGLIQGLAFENGAIARRVSNLTFERGAIAETCGPNGEVLKLIPPLTIAEAELREGMARIGGAIRAAGADRVAGATK